MKKLKLFIISIPFCMLAISSWLHAQNPQEQQTPPVATSPLVSWISKDAGDIVVIENGTGAFLNIMINVMANTEDSAGINIKNCGSTTHIESGSSAICVTNDIKNPVSFSSDKMTPVSGTYQITQQLPK